MEVFSFIWEGRYACPWNFYLEVSSACDLLFWRVTLLRPFVCERGSFIVYADDGIGCILSCDPLILFLTCRKIFYFLYRFLFPCV